MHIVARHTASAHVGSRPTVPLSVSIRHGELPQASTAIITDLVSFVLPPLVHSVGPLRRERGHVVPVGLDNEAGLQWVQSQAGTCVPLLVDTLEKGETREWNFIHYLTFP